MSIPTNHEDNNDLKDLFKPRSEEKEVEHDSFMLMAAFLSEIEYIQEQQDISRKDLAGKIKTSPSYLTQVFRGRKPLNFLTLAKIKRALNIVFEVKAYPKNVTNIHGISVPVYKPIPVGKFAKECLSNIHDTTPVIGSMFTTSVGCSTTAPQTIKKSNPLLT